MKKLILLLIFPCTLFAQSVTLDPSSISVPLVNTIPTCDASAKGKMIYNNNKQVMLYCNGTSWVSCNLTLPFDGFGVVADADAFKVTNGGEGGGITAWTQAEGNSYAAILGSARTAAPTGTTYGVFAENRSVNANGVGLYAKHFGAGTAGYFEASNNGTAIVAEGKLRFFGSAVHPGAGKVLTSDANGNATWEGSAGFSAYNSGASVVVAHNTNFVIPFTQEYYDHTANFQLNSAAANKNTFIAPANGVYHFDASVLWTLSNNAAGSLEVGLWVNGIRRGAVRADANTGNTQFQSSLSKDLLLASGDKVTVTVYQNTGFSQGISSVADYCHFSGHLIYRQ